MIGESRAAYESRLAIHHNDLAVRAAIEPRQLMPFEAVIPLDACRRRLSVL